MKRFSLLMLLTAVLGGVAFLGHARADDTPNNPPPRQDGGPGGPDANGGPGPNGGPGGNGQRPPRRGGVHLIPPFVMSKLDLTDDQKKQIADLEKDVKEKLSKILTPEQMKTLETTRPPRGPGGGGNRPGGQGGPDSDSKNPPPPSN